MPSVIQNVVFPLDRDPDVLPLYMDPETWSRIGKQTVRVSTRAHIDDVLSRGSVRVRKGQRVSFASYFNAFPASYWQHSTTVRAVTLTLETTGAGTVLIYRSNSQGVPQRVESRAIEGSATTAFELPVTTFGDGGWYWFDIVANDENVVLLNGTWSTDAAPVRTGNVSLGITTMNKPDYCVHTLRALSEQPELLDNIDTIYLVDQGTKKVADEPDFPAVRDALGATLRVIDQSNLGGSGGFSRAMAETVDAGTSDFVLLLDDDVSIEPESILRALRFARHCATPTVVGGHMFDLLDKPILHAFAETIDRHPFLWKPLFDEQVRHDFRIANLRQTPWMHTRMDADYNGWWMCMIPVEVVKDIGLSLPVFIKWDDAEYGLRASAAGYPTVSLPGAALWHISWMDKDDAVDWQAYYHARNRFVAALLHSPFKAGGRLLSNSRRQDLKHLLSMQYYAVTLRHEGLRDLLRGPSHLHETMPTKLPTLRARAADFREMQVISLDDEQPRTQEGKRVYAPESDPAPSGAGLAAFTAKAARRHWMTKPAPGSTEMPQVELAKRDATWWRVPNFDSALISTADGRGKSWYTRDRAKFRSLFMDSIRLHRELEKNWDALSAAYRSELAEYTSIAAWRKTFER